MTPSAAEMTEFGPELYGVRLTIDPENYSIPEVVAIDVETDEGTGFVGIGLCFNDNEVFYFSQFTDRLKEELSKVRSITHNGKFDLKMLLNWGVLLRSEHLFFDTALASYVVNTTKESHHLKDLAKEILGYSWPTYKEMVGTGKKKVTLDKQDIERVARYCGMDVLATYKLYQHFTKTMTPTQKHVLETIELPVARVLMEMELKGVQIDLTHLKALNVTFSLRLAQLKEDLNKFWTGAEPYNVNSNRQTAALLESQGALLPLTAKGNKQVNKATLERWQHLPATPLLLEYSKIEKLHSTYTQGLLKQNLNGRVNCDFNQISKTDKGIEFGIATGRLSSSNPNLQNIPTRTEEGKLIMKAFIADEGNILINADYSQIEPRLTAHLSKDPFLLDVYTNGRDLYSELVKDTGRSRQDGKTFMLALLYGAQPKKLASVFKCSEEESEDILNAMWKKLPGVKAWISRIKWDAHRKLGVTTLHKRFIPLPDIVSHNRFERLHWERVAVNSIIQGSAAEIMKLALIKLKKHGYIPNLTVHDSVLINVPHTEIPALEIGNIMETIVKLDIPLKVDVGYGTNWMEAKNGK